MTHIISRVVTVALAGSMFLTGAAALIAGEYCLYSYETTSGLNKTCVYSCPSGEMSLTIYNVKLCPLSVTR